MTHRYKKTKKKKQKTRTHSCNSPKTDQKKRHTRAQHSMYCNIPYVYTYSSVVIVMLLMTCLTLWLIVYTNNNRHNN